MLSGLEKVMEGTDRESEGERDFTGVESEQRREEEERELQRDPTTRCVNR